MFAIYFKDHKPYLTSFLSNFYTLFLGSGSFGREGLKYYHALHKQCYIFLIIPPSTKMQKYRHKIITLRWWAVFRTKCVWSFNVSWYFCTSYLSRLRYYNYKIEVVSSSTLILLISSEESWFLFNNIEHLRHLDTFLHAII